MLLNSYKDRSLPKRPSPLLPAAQEVSSWYDRLRMKDGGGKLYMHTTQDVFLFGDSFAASSATQLFSQAGARLVRIGVKIYMYIGKNGAEPKRIANTEVSFRNPVLVGLAVSSHHVDASDTVLFSDVAVEEQPMPAQTQ